MNDLDLVEVRLIGIPLAIHRVASEHMDGLNREFTLLALQADADPAGVPARLIALSRELSERFRGFAAGPQAQLDAARERGEEQLDLTYRVPRDTGSAAKRLADMLEEADAYCRAGTDLLTLVAPGIVVTYRNWFLNEFARQVQGQPPLPWSQAETPGEH